MADIMVSGALIGIIIITTTTGTRFGGYLPVHAGPGKLDGTGDGVTAGIQVVLLSDLDSEQQRR